MIDTQELHELLNELEQSEDPHWELAYRSTLESWVAELMEEIYQHPHAENKMRLVVLEYRARLIHPFQHVFFPCCLRIRYVDT